MSWIIRFFCSLMSRRRTFRFAYRTAPRADLHYVDIMADSEQDAAKLALGDLWLNNVCVTEWYGPMTTVIAFPRDD